jgi:Ca-activated chloride channel family protein
MNFDWTGLGWIGLPVPGLDGVTLLRPLWLLAVPLVLLLAVATRRRGDLGDWRRAVDPPLLAALTARGAVVAAGRRGLALSPWLVAAAPIALALAGPAVERRDAAGWRNLDGLVVALDVSRSVAEGGAFDEARFAALQVAEAASGRQAALAVYAGDAYLASAFSTDRAALRPLVAAGLAGSVPDPGSQPVRAIALAAARFTAAGMPGGDLVLVTDGGGIEAATLDAAARFAADGRRLHVVHVPSFMPDGTATGDRGAAARLAVAGGGRFADTADPAAVAAAVAEPASARLSRSGFTTLAWMDLGRTLLALAAMPLLMLFRRRT